MFQWSVIENSGVEKLELYYVDLPESNSFNKHVIYVPNFQTLCEVYRR